MNTLTIELTNEKALKLLQDMEDLKLIRVIKMPVKLSSLRSQIKTQMSLEAIENQVNDLRNELPDAFISATAIVHNLTLIADNDKDFLKVAGLKYINPNSLK